MPPSERLHAVVRGRVQGVAFRWHAVQEAERLALTGTITNRPDGEVEIVAEGARQHLEALLAWARHGSPGARVEGVRFEYAPATKEFNEFVVVR